MTLPRATFRFYAELNEFLPPAHRGVPFERMFSGRPAVKDAIESLGVPHTEVDLVLLDGQSVDFGAPVPDGARGSHHRHMQQLIAELSRELAADGNFA